MHIESNVLGVRPIYQYTVGFLVRKNSTSSRILLQA